MKTKHHQNGVIKFYGPMLSGLFVAFVFVSFTAAPQDRQENPGEFTINPTAKKVQQIYTSQIGIRERPSNSGPDVEKYLRYVNLSKGDPWCAAFVCWVFNRAGVANPRSGWSPDLFPVHKVIWQRAESGKLKTEKRSDEPRAKNVIASVARQKEQGLPQNAMSEQGTKNVIASIARQKESRLPQGALGDYPGTGDVFGIYFPEKKRIAHVGFVDQWDGTWLITVEGNTNITGSREGDGVYRKRRLVKSIYKVARYINAQKPLSQPKS